VRGDWLVRALGDVADVQSGGTPARARSEFWKGDIAWYSSGELNGIYTSVPQRKITEAGLANSSAKLFPKGSLLIGMYDTAALKMSILDRDAAFNQAIAGVVPNDKIDLRFVLNAINFMKPQILDQRRGVRQKNLSLGKIKSIPIPIPPLLEQQRIVAILDEAFAGLAIATANAEKNLKNARELFDSYLGSVFASTKQTRIGKSLGEVCAISSKLVSPRDPRYIDLPHLGAGNMVSRTGELIDIKTAREEELISGKFFFDRSMVLYSKIRPYLMKACRPDFDGLCSADVYPLSPDTAQLDRNYLFHLLLSDDFTTFAIAGSDRAGMPKVNREHLFKYRT
jgi:type I restriction enzyme S subunit